MGRLRGRFVRHAGTLVASNSWRIPHPSTVRMASLNLNPRCYPVPPRYCSQASDLPRSSCGPRLRAALSRRHHSLVTPPSQGSPTLASEMRHDDGQASFRSHMTAPVSMMPWPRPRPACRPALGSVGLDVAGYAETRSAMLSVSLSSFLTNLTRRGFRF